MLYYNIIYYIYFFTNPGVYMNEKYMCNYFCPTSPPSAPPKARLQEIIYEIKSAIVQVSFVHR